MKKKLIIGIAIGLALGLAQLFIPYSTNTPSKNPIATEYHDGRQYFRGVPLKSQPAEPAPMPSPPFSATTFINIPILILLSTGLVYATWPIVTVLTQTKRRRVITTTGLVLGLVLGVGQLYYYSTRTVSYPPVDITNLKMCTPETEDIDCNFVCKKENLKGKLCYISDVQADVRGWPYKHDTYKLGWSWNVYEVGPLLAVNFFLFLIATPLVFGTLGVITDRPKKAKPRKSKP